MTSGEKDDVVEKKYKSLSGKTSKDKYLRNSTSAVLFWGLDIELRTAAFTLF